MALTNLDLLLRSEQTSEITAVQRDATFLAIEAAVNALNAAVTPQTVSITTGAKVGATAGWTIADATDRGGLGKCPASQTAATVVVPLSGLPVGRQITGFTVRGQVESAGGAVTLDAALRSLTVAATDITDAAVSSITQVSVTADAAVAAAVSGLAATIAAGVTYYVLLTATTAASTDIDLASIDVTLAVP